MKNHTIKPTTIEPDQWISLIVAENPSTSIVFEKYKIDYCCGGKISLRAKLKEMNIDLDAVILDLSENLDETKENENKDSFLGKDLNEIIDYILVEFHEPLKQDLPRIGGLLQKINRVHGDRYAYLQDLEREFSILQNDLDLHMMKEEKLLFPLIRSIQDALDKNITIENIHCGTVVNPITQMEFEHDNVGKMLRRLREITHDFTPPPDACNSFLAAYDGLSNLEHELHRHIHMENHLLHPKAKEYEKRVAC